MVKDVLFRLGCPTPTLDMFADAKNTRFPRYWGEGGERPDAWKENWGKKELGTMWCNPPFTELDWVVQKTKAEGGNLIFIAPDWRDRKFYEQMWDISRAHHYYKAGTGFFELDGAAVPGIKWGVWAVWLDAEMTGAEKLRRKSKREQPVQRTAAAKRRYRRLRQMEEKAGAALQE